MKTINKDQLKFAQYIAENFDNLSCKEYSSDCGNYKIEILEKLMQNGTERFGPSRTKPSDGLIELNKKNLANHPKKTVLFWILWCWFRLSLKDKDVAEADSENIKYVTSNGLMSTKEVYMAFLEGLRFSESDLNLERVGIVESYYKGQ